MEDTDEPEGVAEIDTDSVVSVSRPRLAILEKLAERPMTVSELSRSLRMSKGTMHRHVGILVDKGHVERRESERPWVYYALSERGRKVRRMVSTRFLLAMTFGAGLSAGAILILLAPRGPPPGGDEFQQAMSELVTDALPSIMLVLAAAFVVTTLLVIRGWTWRRELTKTEDGGVWDLGHD